MVIKAVQEPTMVMMMLIFMMMPNRDAGAIVGQGGRSLEKGTSADYDVIMIS